MITFKRFPFGLFRHPVKLVHPVTLISGCLYHVPSLRQCRVARPSIHVQKRNQTAALSYKNEYIKVFNTIAMINDADHQPEYLIKNKSCVSFAETKHVNMIRNQGREKFRLRSVHISVHNYVM